MVRLLQTLRERVGVFLWGMPWRYRPAATADPALRALQRWHNRVVLQDWPGALRALVFGAEAVIWPFRAAWLAFRLNRGWGGPVQAACGLGRGRQWCAAWRHAVVHRLRPADYYHLDFWRHAGAPADYLLDGHTRHLFRAINRGVDVSLLDDKRAFWAFCRAHDLASPPLLAVLAEGRIERLVEPTAFACDLFFKQRVGLRGEGAAPWIYDASTRTYTRRGGDEKLDLPRLLERFAARSKRRPYLVQPGLADHPEIADLGNGTLCVIRVITVVTPEGPVREFASILKAPLGGTFLTNLSDGALFCPIDSEQGTLRAGFVDGIGKTLREDHPVTGARVAGRRLPRWREAVELACAAHRQMPQVAFIGWDVALTAAGPQLLEGNHGLAITPFNFPPNVPLGRTGLPRLLVWHLQRKYGAVPA